MNTPFHTPVKKSLHRLELVEKLLMAVGYTGIDDYKTSLRSKDLIQADVTDILFELGYEIKSDLMGTLKTILRDHGVPYDMVHKRDGNYWVTGLQLESPKTDLIDYINQKHYEPKNTVLDVPADFSYKDYLSKLTAV